MKSSTKVWIVLFGIGLYYLFKSPSKNNVCSTYNDYFNIENSKNCWYDPDVLASVSEIVARRNLPLETYRTTTEDGYQLTTFRIPQKEYSKGVILLDHGIGTTSDLWTDKGNSSYAFLLHEAGYDVWLGNLRGSKYSSNHTSLSTNKFEYWDWSFHEYGYYDIKSQIDLIKSVTNRNDIVYIGYSISAFASVAYASLRPDEAQSSVKVFINLALSPYLKRAWGYLPAFANQPVYGTVKAVNEYLRIGAIPHGTFTHWWTSQMCLAHPFKYLCVFLTLPMSGWPSDFNPALIPATYSKLPDGSSWKCVYHLSQLYMSERLQHYDYGEEGNLARYGSSIPPLYPIENIKVPFYGINGDADFVAHPDDVEEFLEALPVEAKIYGNYRIKDYNHFDYVYGKHVKEKVIDHLIDFINKIL